MCLFLFSCLCFWSSWKKIIRNSQTAYRRNKWLVGWSFAVILWFVHMFFWTERFSWKRSCRQRCYQSNQLKFTYFFEPLKWKSLCFHWLSKNLTFRYNKTKQETFEFCNKFSMRLSTSKSFGIWCEKRSWLIRFRQNRVNYVWKSGAIDSDRPLHPKHCKSFLSAPCQPYRTLYTTNQLNYLSINVLINR